MVTSRYVDLRGRDRRVRYWAMRPISGCFRPNREVDAIRWVNPADAEAMLTYAHERSVLQTFRFPIPEIRLAAS